MDEAAQRKYSFVKFLHDRNWAELAKVQDYTLERFDAEFRSAAKVAKFIAQAKLGNAKGKSSLEKLLAEETLSSRAKYTLYELSASSEVRPIIQIAYTYGLSVVSRDSDLGDILSFCRLAQRLHDWRRIIELLKDVAAPEENTEETRILALAYVNDYPIREGAVKFFKTLGDSGISSEYLLLLSGLFCFKHRNFKDAKEKLNSYLENDGRDAMALLALTDIARLESDDKELERLLSAYDSEEIQGNPEQLIHLAKLLTLHGDAKKGLMLGYEVYNANSKSAEIALAYSQLFLFSGQRIEIESIDTVSPGVCFTLSSSEGVTLERTVDDNYDDLFQLDPDSIDQYTRKVYGFKSGDSYVQEKMQGDVTWTVTEIKHKYLRAFHYILRNYELDFPNAGGFWAMKMEGDDVQPLLDFIKKSAEHDENVISDLCSKRFPLSVIGKLWNKNTVKVSDMVRSFKGEIFTCIGTAEEREKAYEKINDFSKNGIVLDSYTAWVASIPSILNALKKSYKKIIVARSTIVELLHLCEELKGAAGSSLSVGWSNGQFHRTVTTDEERDALIADIRGV
ncbi:hypothetical protein P4114_07335 [Pseudomonas aeruginosa]|nr:hypothetical protein [Pseudomonas aeruginosa]